MKRILVILILFSPAAIAQRMSVTGQLSDSIAGPLTSATVLLLQQQDSTLAGFSVSDAHGNFVIRNMTKGEYFFKVSFVGYSTYVKKISLSGGTDLNLGKITMKQRSMQLGEVVVEAERAPVVVKRDTIEFNAGSFKTKINATAEDLLKKLPGVEVDNDGTIRAQGEQVQRVMVDGKEFFGQDPKLATRNLPADAIDKVQIYDKKSDQTVFTGIDDGQREKTVNLELKEEKRHASFGNSTAGIGTDDRFKATSNINRFNKGNQLSFLGMANNINEQGFTMGDFANFSGGMQGGGGGGPATQTNSDNSQGGPQINTGRQNGIVTNYASGLNTNQTINHNKTKINASYFYNRLDQNLATDLHRLNYLPHDSSYNLDQHSMQHTVANNHRAAVTADHQIDSANSVKFTATTAFNQSRQTITSISQTTFSDGSVQNESDRYTRNTGNSTTLNSSLLFRHRFARKGRTISANLTLGYSQNDTDGNLNSVNTFYAPTEESQEILQKNTQVTDNYSYGATVTYTEPLGGRKYLEANYSYKINHNNVDRQVYNQVNGEDVPDVQLSNKYTSDYIYSRPGVNFRLNRQKFTVTAGVSYQQTQLKGNLVLQNERINRNFERVLPAARFNYDFTTFKHVRFDYETSLQEPSIQQLQPIVDNSDPLNISVGNPQLQPAYSHRVRSNFMMFDPANFFNIFAFINASYTDNAIVNSQTTDQNLVRTTKPVNVGSNMSLNSTFNLGLPVKALNSRFNIGPNFTTTRGMNLINDEQNTMNQRTVGGNMRYNYSLKEILIVDLGATLSNQETRYSFSTEQNQSFFNKAYTAEVNLNFLKNYALNSSFDYFVYDSRTTDFHQTIPLWNLSVSRYVLKNKTGEIKLAVNNMLDQSLSVTQTANTNYLEQETTNNIGRFFMVSFTYALNKQLNMAGNMRRLFPGGKKPFE